MDLAAIGPIVGALGIGSLITQYLTSGRSRREVRGAVLKQLAEVEKARWAGGDDDPGFQGFRKEVHSLQTAALIARIPRRAMTYYLVFAQAARWDTQDFVEERGYDDDFGVLLSAPLSDLVTGAVLNLNRVAWSPWLGRLILPWHLWKLRKKAAACDEDDLRRIKNAQGTNGTIRGLPAPDNKKV